MRGKIVLTSVASWSVIVYLSGEIIPMAQTSSAALCVCVCLCLFGATKKYDPHTRTHKQLFRKRELGINSLRTEEVNQFLRVFQPRTRCTFRLHMKHCPPIYVCVCLRCWKLSNESKMKNNLHSETHTHTQASPIYICAAFRGLATPGGPQLLFWFRQRRG